MRDDWKVQAFCGNCQHVNAAKRLGVYSNVPQLNCDTVFFSINYKPTIPKEKLKIKLPHQNKDISQYCPYKKGNKIFKIINN